jgi:hypothetical protein
MAAEQPSPTSADPEDTRPPLGSWGRLYALLLCALATEIALLWALSRAFG